MEEVLNYFSENAVEIFAIVGGIYTVLRTIVLLTPTPADDQLFKAADGYFSKILGILAKIGGIDTTQGTKKGTTKTDKGVTSLVIYAIIIGSCVGCSSWKTIKQDPRAELLAYDKLYTQSVTALTTLKAKGVFTEDQKKDIGGLVDKGAAYLVLWHDSIETTQQRPSFAENAIFVIESLATYIIEDSGGAE